MSRHPLTPDQIREVVGTDEDRERWAAQDAFLQQQAAQHEQFARDLPVIHEAGRQRFRDEYSTEGYLDREAERQIEQIRETRARRRR